MKRRPSARIARSLLAGVAAWLALAGLRAQPQVAPEPASARKAAIFVLNREARVPGQQVKMLEDFIAARVATQGFQTLTRDMVVDSISRAMQQPAEGKTTTDAAFLQQIHDLAKNAGSGLVEPDVEQQLNAQSSFMRLAQTIDADLIVFATIESFGTEKREFKGNDLAPVATTTIFNTLRVSYRLAFAATGGAVAGDTVRVTRAWRESTALNRVTDDLLPEMFDEAAQELAKKIQAANRAVTKVPKVVAGDVRFEVRPVLPGGTSLQLPVYRKEGIDLPVSTTVVADVMLDGISVGSVPGELKLATGLHQIAIQAEGFKPWKRFVNLSPGQKIDVLLELTPEGYEKWKEVIGFLAELSRRERLTDAEVKQMEAKAEAMRKAGLIVTIGQGSLEVIRKK